MRLVRMSRAYGITLGTFLMVALLIVIAMLNKSVAISILAGALTGLAEGALMFPLENLKIQQQLDGATVRHAIGRTVRTHGFFGLYKGIFPVLVGAIPSQAIRWGVFEAYCLMADCRDLSQVGVGAVLSGAINSVLTGVAIETMKVSLIHSHVDQTKTAAGKSIAGIGSDFDEPVASIRIGLESPSESDATTIPIPLQNHKGHPDRVTVVALRGWLPTVSKKIVNQSIRFPAHSWALRSLCQHFVLADATTVTCKHGHPLMSFTAGVFSGLSSVLITQPLDVTKTRLQGLSGHKYRNTLHCIRTIAAEEGLQAFMHGAGLRAFRVSLGAGLSFTLFPWIQSLLSRMWDTL